MLNQKFLKRIAVMALLPVSISGCATIDGRQNNDQMVLFEATPRVVEVTCSGETIATPGSIALKQSRSHTCHAEREGFESKSFRIRSHISKVGFKASTDSNLDRWGWWTLGIGVLVGWSVDFVSGAMRNLEHNDYHVTLAESGTTGTGKAVVNKSVQLGQAILSAPKDIVDTTTTTVMDSTLRAGSEKVGFESTRETVHYPSPEGAKKV